MEQGNHWPIKKRVGEGKCSCSTNTGLMFFSFLACSYRMVVHSLGHLWFGDSADFREVIHWDLTCNILRYCHCGESSEVLYGGFLAIAMLDGTERWTAEWSGLRWEQAQITTTSGLVQISLSSQVKGVSNRIGNLEKYRQVKHGHSLGLHPFCLTGRCLIPVRNHAVDPLP